MQSTQPGAGELVLGRLRISLLADHPEAIPVLKGWFETEWPDYYGSSGPGSAEQDLIASATATPYPSD